jgi:hypothetical protein
MDPQYCPVPDAQASGTQTGVSTWAAASGNDSTVPASFLINDVLVAVEVFVVVLAGPWSMAPPEEQDI